MSVEREESPWPGPPRSRPVALSDFARIEGAGGTQMDPTRSRLGFAGRRASFVPARSEGLFKVSRSHTASTSPKV
jgi:hypothetical protein